MDDNSFNIHNNLLTYSKSPFFSTTSTSKENMPKENNTKKSQRQINCSIDLDQSDSEGNSFKNISMNNIENKKLEYRRKLIANLNNKKNLIIEKKQNSEEKSGTNTQPVSIKRSVQSVNSENSNSYTPKSKTNYRTICDDIDSKPPRNSISSNSRLDNSGFLSLSRQSLNDSLNEPGITNTASRITANILKHNLTKKTETSPKTIPNVAISAKCPTRTLRYKTITKKDNFSSYLTRVANDVDLFGSPSTTPVSLSLNLTENSSVKRVDFSKIIKTPDLKRQKSNTATPTQTWNCSNCEASNPSSFNFCPICSAPNPKLTLSGKLNLKRFHNDRSKCGWECQRCSTKNEDDQNSCIFCFKNKTDLSETETPFIKKRKILENSDEIERENEAFKFTENEKNTKFAFGDNSSSIFKFGSNTESVAKANLDTSKEKWNCPTCLVDNSVDKESCPCCLTKQPNSQSGKVVSGKPSFVFGNNSSENALIKFGSNDESTKQSNKPGQLNDHGDVSTVQFGSNSNDKWNCPTCMVDNAAGKDSCPCCMTRKPNVDSKKTSSEKPLLFQFASSSAQSSSFKFGSNVESPSETATFNGIHSSDKWNCPTCMVDNRADLDKCPCCCTKNPNVLNSKLDDKTSQENWNCQTCLVDNTADKDSCPCCLTKNPKIKSATINAEKPLLKFGNYSSSTSAFKFGSNHDSESKIESDASLFKIGNNSSSTSTFKFGSNSESSSTIGTEKPVLKFGNGSSSTTSFKFGSNHDSESKIGSDASLFKIGNNSSSTTTFKFGSNSESSSTIDKETLVFKFGNNCSSKTTFQFGSKSDCPPTISSSKPAGSTGDKWNCALCLVDNVSEASACVCCQTARPVDTKKSYGLTGKSVDNVKVSAVPTVNGIDQGSTTASSSVTKSLFLFGTSKTDSAVVKPADSDDSTDLVFKFSAATSLGITSKLQVPVDLDFEFAAPLLL